jgi:nitroreductase
MNDAAQVDEASPRQRIRPLLRARQVREFTDQPLTSAELDALTDVARWSGSARNGQPWRFIAIRDIGTVRRIAEAGLPHTRSLQTATAAIAIVMPAEPARAVTEAYDEGRVAERLIVAAGLLELGAGISWVRKEFHEAIAVILGLPPDRTVRTIVALGHPTEAARRSKSAPGQARLPREEVVFEERWPAS